MKTDKNSKRPCRKNLFSGKDRTVSCVLNAFTADVDLSIKRKLAQGYVEVMISKKLPLSKKVELQTKITKAWFRFTGELRHLGIR